MLPFVAQVSRAQQSVHDGMHQHVPVAVAHQSLVMGHRNAAQDEAAVRAEGVGVKAYAGAVVKTNHSD